MADQEQPKTQQIQATVVAPDSKGQFKLNLSKGAVSRVDVVDLDFVITTKDGKRLVLPSAAIDATSDHPPAVAFSDGTVGADSFYSQVQKVQTPEAPVPAMASLVTDTPQKGSDKSPHHDQSSKDAGESQDQAPLNEAPQSSLERLLQQADKESQDVGNKHKYDEAPHPASTANQTPSNSNSGNGQAPATIDVSPVLTIYFGNLTGTTSTTSGGVTTINGSGGLSGTSASGHIDGRAMAQEYAQTITGTTGSDIIYANGQMPTNATATLFEKTLEVDLSGSFQQITSIKITGYASDDLHYLTGSGVTWNTTDNAWEIAVSSTGTLTAFDLNMIYGLTSTSSTDDPVHETYTVVFSVDVTLSSGGVTTLLETQVLEVRDVTSSTDLTALSDSLGHTVWVLPAQGISNLIQAGSGNDTIIGGQAGDTLYGNAGNDVILAGSGNDTLIGGAGGDTLSGGAGTDIASYSDSTSGQLIDLSGTYSSGTLTAGAHATGDASGDVYINIERVQGSKYADTFIGGTDYGSETARMIIDGASGSDYIDYEYATAAVKVDFLHTTTAGYASVGGAATNDLLINIENAMGSAYGDTLIASTTSQTLMGLAGDDTLIGSSSGGDYLDGGAGTDAISFASQTAGLTIDMVGSGTWGTGAAYGNTYVNIENVIGTNYDDTFIGGTSSGSGLMDGGSYDNLGNWISYYHATAAATVNLSTGTNGGSAVNDRLSNIENIIGSTLADLLIGDSSSNIILAGSGNDTLMGGTGGYDTLDGGAGTDILSFADSASSGTITQTLGTVSTSGLVINVADGTQSTGDASNDVITNIEKVVGTSYDDTYIGGTNTAMTFDGGSGNNWVDYTNAQAVTLNLTGNTATGIGVTHLGGAASDFLINVENVKGSTLGDVITGNSSATGSLWGTLMGNDGNDTLIAGSANYWLDGGLGTNTLKATYGNTKAIADYEDSSVGVTVSLSSAYTLVSSVLVQYATGTAVGYFNSSIVLISDTLSNIENVYGSTGNDVLIGNTMANTLWGGAGNDTVAGGGGGDYLDGGAGNDLLSYSTATSGVTINMALGTGLGTGLGGAAASDQFINFEQVLGSSYADTIIGGSGLLSIDGGSGLDTISYNDSHITGGVTVDLSANKAVVGGVTTTLSNFENIWGSSGNDTLTGDSADNSIHGGSGSDAIDGGGGNNWVLFDDQSAAVVIDLAHGTARTSSGTDTLANVENVIGSNYGDTIIGDANSDTLIGGTAGDTIIGGNGTGVLMGDLAYTSSTGGNDTLIAGTGNNTLYGGGGNDLLSINGGTGTNILYAGYGNDTLIDGGGGINTLVGGTGNDTLIAGAGTDLLYGGTGNNYMEAGTGHATLWGSSGADTLVGVTGTGLLMGGIGGDTLIGGTAGVYTLQGGTGADTLIGQAGTAFADYSEDSSSHTITLGLGWTAAGAGGDAASDVLYNIENVIGGSGADTLIGDANANTLYGGAGNDVLYGSAGGGDYLDGGSGTDIVTFANSASGLTIDLTSGGHSSGYASGDTFVNIEIVKGSNADDTFIGGTTGAATMDGGSGNNWVDYEYVASAATINLGTTAYSGAAASDHLLNVENIIGSNYGDKLTGDSSANSILGGTAGDTIAGGGGNDYLDGGSGQDVVDYSASTAGLTVNLLAGTAYGNASIGTDTLANFEVVLGGTGSNTLIADNNGDTLIGGSGNDSFFTGTGNDSMDGGSGIDLVNYGSQTGSLTINLGSTATGGSIGTDTFYNIEIAYGGSGADSLIAASSGSTLYGNEGDDTFWGGAGNDRFDGGSGNNAVSYASQTANLTISLGTTANGSAVGGTVGTDTLVNIEVVFGGSGSDILIAGSAADSLYGGAGADTLIGGSGNDLLDGGSGQDIADYHTKTGNLVVTLNGASAGTAAGGVGIGTDSLVNVEVVLGALGNNTLIADSLGDSLYGNSSADTFIGGVGNDVMDGGGGADTVDYSSQAGALTINLSSSVTGGTVGTDILANIEVAIGGAGADTLIAGAGHDSLYGGLGNDTLISGSGNDLLDGGGGNDLVTYSSMSSSVTVNMSALTASGTGVGTDTLANIEIVQGGTGNDKFIGAFGGVTLDGFTGAQDIIDYSGQAGSVTIDLAGGSAIGGAGSDILTNFEVAVGGASADTLIAASAGADSLYGGLGGDTLVGVLKNDFLDGGSGSDVVDYSAQTSGITVSLNGSAWGWASSSLGTDILTNVEIIRGGQGDDTLIADTAGDSLYGWSGNDTLIGGAGNDVLDGGVGTANVADYSTATGNLAIALNGASAGTATGGGIGTDLLYNIEILKGGIGNDTLMADGLGDSLYGGAGNDTLIGGVGNDVLDGGSGTNTLSYAAQTASVTVDLGGGHAYGSGIATDTLSNFRIVLGGSGDDTIIGNTAGDTLYGNGGNNLLMGNTASLNSDTFYGGTGIDTIIGSSGATGNYMDYSSEASAVTVNLALGSAWGSSIGTDYLTNIEVVRGGSSSNVLVASSANTTLYGGAGNDTLIGGAGADYLDGGAGTADLVDYSSATGNLVVTVGSQASGAGIGIDTLVNVEIIKGGQGNDTLVADNKGDTLYGLTGNDTLYGGTGNDLLDGGIGQDMVDYHSQTAGLTITLTGSGTGTATGSGIGTDLLYNIEVFTGGSGSDLINGKNLTTSATLYGYGGNNTLYGGAAADTFYGGTGIDTIDGGTGIDTISYAAETASLTANLSSGSAVGSSIGTDYLYNLEVVWGGISSDTLIANNLGDSLYGFSGNDTLIGGTGNDLLDGGIGTDTVDYSGLTGPITLVLNGTSAGSAVTTGYGTDTLYNIEIAVGSRGNDTLIADSLGDSLWGYSGNDTLVGGAGNDVMDGGAGTGDVAYYAGLSSGITVTLNGTGAGTAITTGNGTDTLYNIEILQGSQGDDTLIADTLGDTLYGNSGNDDIFGGSGNDLLDGGSGQDILDYSNQNSAVLVVLNGTSLGSASGTSIHTDSLYNFEVVLGGSAADTIIGDALGDTLYGNAGNDTVIGGAAADTLYGGIGSNTLDGKGGTDYLDYTAATSALTINLGSAGGTSLATAGTATNGANFTDLLINMEVVWGSSAGDTIIGNNSGDSLYGFSGNDTISGGTGNDLMDGGVGTDTLDYRSVATAVTIALKGAAVGTATGTGIGTDTLYNFEIAYGGQAADTLMASGQGDTLFGYSGGDTLIGGAGNDYLDGGTGQDMVDYSGGSVGVLVVMNGTSAGSAKGSSIGTDTLYNFEIVKGSAGNDTLIGDSQNVTFVNSFGGTSTLGDTFIGSSGSDTIIGKTGVVNTLDYSAMTTSVTANLGGTAAGGGISTAGTATGGILGTDYLYNIEVVLGGTANDSLIANNLGDSLYGGTGNDYLVGGTGNDVIDGGVGQDIVDYRGQTAVMTFTLSGAGNGTATGGTVGTDLLYNLEVFYGGSGSNSIIGTSLTSAATIYGGTGLNTIMSGAGNDWLYGGISNDTLDGGTGTNTVDYSGLNSSTGQTGALLINLGSTGGNTWATRGSATGGTISTDMLINIEVALGGSGNDTLIGNGLGDSLYGGIGNDTLISGSGNDLLDGGSGTNTLDYRILGSAAPVTVLLNGAAAGTAITTGYGTDTLYNVELVQGGTGSDVLWGDGLGDTLFGNAGNDTLFGGLGKGNIDSLDGGAGTDLADYHTMAVGVTLAMSGTTGSIVESVAASGTDLLYNIEAVLGTSLADVLSAAGTTAAMTLFGGSGNDTIIGGSGIDSLDGGAGNDFLDYHAQTGTLTINLGTGGGTSWATAGSATGSTVATDYLVNFEIVEGGTAADKIYANNLGDTLYGWSGADTLFGGTSNDVLDGRGYTNTADTSTDWADYRSQTSALTVWLNGASAGSAIGGTVGTDTLYNIEGVAGSANSNYYYIQNYYDGTANFGHTLMGGTGTDTVDYSGVTVQSGGYLAIYLGQWTWNGTTITTTASYNGTSYSAGYGGGGAANDRYINIENVIGSTGGDYIAGSTASNYIYGGSGGDTLSGNGNSDTLDGGAGSDWVFYQWLGATGVTITMGSNASGTTGTAVYSGTYAGTDTLLNFEYVYGDIGADLINLKTVTASMVIDGAGGADTILAGSGNDTIRSDHSSDTVDGGFGNDGIVYNIYAGNAGVTVNLGTSALSGVASDGSTFTEYLYNIETVVGSSGNDVLIAGSTNSHLLQEYFGLNTLIGGSGGSITLEGGQNDDTLISGFGSETLDGGGYGGGSGLYGNANTGIWSSSTAGLTINLYGTAVGTATWGGTGVDKVYNIEDVIGSTLADYIYLHDTFNHVINGNGGADSLYGGAGNDTFVLTATQLASVSAVTVDGGAGTNWLYSAGSNLSTGSIPNHISNIEVIDLHNDSASSGNTASLSYSDITSILGSGFTTLTLLLNSGGTYTTSGTENLTSTTTSTLTTSSYTHTFTVDHYDVVGSTSTVHLDVYH